MKPVRVLIVDDSASARRALAGLLADDPGVEVMGLAGDAFEAAEKMRHALPDVILLDIQLPKMDGLTFLARIMAQRPIPVVICSGTTGKGSAEAMRALELGACDVIGKPRLDTPKAREEAQVRLCDAVHAAAQVGLTRRRSSAGPASPALKPLPKSPGPKLTADAILPPPKRGGVQPLGMEPIVAIGASTGGTEALAAMLPLVPADCVPIVIVQHMPEKFTTAFSRRLDGLCRASVREAQDGDRPERGTVLIAPGDRHLIIRRQGKGYRASVVDVLFRSVAVAAGGASLGILMTGMGDDGAHGLLEMREAGAETIVQDERSSVVWGMPGEAWKLGAAQRAVPLDGLAAEVARYAQRLSAT